MLQAVSRKPAVLAVGAPPAYVQRLVERGYVVNVSESGTGLRADAHHEEVLLYWQGDRKAARPYIEGMPSLRWVHVPWIGIEGLLFPRIRSGEVILTNSPNVASAPVAEYVIGALLSIAKLLPMHHRNQQHRAWPREKRFSAEVAGKRLLIVGYGDIGARVGRYAQALGMQVDAIGREARQAGEVSVQHISQLDASLADADYVLLAVPSTPQTRPLMTADRLSRLQPHAWLLNVGRGDAIDEGALLNSVRSGNIGGAWLDVVCEEPLRPDSPLWEEPSIVITPHASSWTRERFDRSFELFLRNLELSTSGRPLQHVISTQGVIQS